MRGGLMTCIICGSEIPSSRLDILPHTTTCKDCSTEKPVVCFRAFSHKNTSDLIVVHPENKEMLRQATRAFHRSR
ncbi:MAG: hypothetical protein GF411_14480 [Candidatus Lokiarchaeota archaeon]|nr:hypothetical protein [Candidatus Lokiarchaeota archaeon]